MGGDTTGCELGRPRYLRSWCLRGRCFSSWCYGSWRLWYRNVKVPKKLFSWFLFFCCRIRSGPGSTWGGAGAATGTKPRSTKLLSSARSNLSANPLCSSRHEASAFLASTMTSSVLAASTCRPASTFVNSPASVTLLEPTVTHARSWFSSK